MEKANDFSWNSDKLVSNKKIDKNIHIESEPSKDSILTISSHSDVKNEMDELVEEFKHRITDIISREKNKK